jgi:DNA repair photolyase
MNARLARQLEPRAPRPDLRMRTVKELREAGLRAGVMCSPLMPGITDSASSIRAVARSASAAGASFLASGALFLKSCSLPTFLSFIGEHFPEQLDAYKRRYASSAFVSSAYRERMGALVNQVCQEFNLGKRYMYEDTAKEEGPAVVETQPWLPFAGGSGEGCSRIEGTTA